MHKQGRTYCRLSKIDGRFACLFSASPHHVTQWPSLIHPTLLAPPLTFRPNAHSHIASIYRSTFYLLDAYLELQELRLSTFLILRFCRDFYASSYTATYLVLPEIKHFVLHATHSKPLLQQASNPYFCHCILQQMQIFSSHPLQNVCGNTILRTNPPQEHALITETCHRYAMPLNHLIGKFPHTLFSLESPNWAIHSTNPPLYHPNASSKS
jgi:hypothetical protein